MVETHEAQAEHAVGGGRKVRVRVRGPRYIANADLVGDLLARAAEVLEARLERGAQWECWRWPGYLADGYGVLHVLGLAVLAHRVAYAAAFGPIPDELDVDHLCYTRACCNPSHLEAVTRSTNSKRAMARQRVLHPTCRAGHERNEANTHRRPDGRTFCRPCHAQRERWRRANARAA